MGDVSVRKTSTGADCESSTDSRRSPGGRCRVTMDERRVPRRQRRGESIVNLMHLPPRSWVEEK